MLFRSDKKMPRGYSINRDTQAGVLPSLSFTGLVSENPVVDPSAIEQASKRLSDSYDVGQGLVTNTTGLLGSVEHTLGDDPAVKDFAGQYQKEAADIAKRYEGRYESRDFQQEVKILNNRYANDPKIMQWSQSKKDADEWMKRSREIGRAHV